MALEKRALVLLVVSGIIALLQLRTNLVLIIRSEETNPEGNKKESDSLLQQATSIFLWLVFEPWIKIM